MAEYANSGSQTVNSGETVIFTETPVPCNRGFVRHRDGSGNFLLSGYVPCKGGCRADSAMYLVEFGANISIPTGQTIPDDGISLAISIDGATIPASVMTVTPAAVEESFNVGRAINVQVWRGCCETVSVRNVSDIPITVSQANVIITRPDMSVTY